MLVLKVDESTVIVPHHPGWLLFRLISWMTKSSIDEIFTMFRSGNMICNKTRTLHSRAI